jgi:hypothetical protein
MAMRLVVTGLAADGATHAGASGGDGYGAEGPENINAGIREFSDSSISVIRLVYGISPSVNF